MLGFAKGDLGIRDMVVSVQGGVNADNLWRDHAEAASYAWFAATGMLDIARRAEQHPFEPLEQRHF